MESPHTELIKGVYDVEEYADDVARIYEQGKPEGLKAGWITFDELYTIPRKSWTVVTGYPGSGKSSWLDNLLVKLAEQHGWKTLICSPESQPIEEHIASLMEIHAGKKFGHPKNRKDGETENMFMTTEQYAHSFAFIGEHFQFINPPDIKFNIRDIVATAQEVKNDQFDFDGFVIDPYNELEHKRISGLSETEYISWVISNFRRFIYGNDLHGWFVAHPTKPQIITMKYDASANESDVARKTYKRATLFDISGAAHWKNKCDFGIVIHRDMHEPSAPSVVEVEKVRKRYQGKRGEQAFFYDYNCNRYYESYIELMNNK